MTRGVARRHARPIVALDFPTVGDAMALVERLGDRCDFYKVGSELFTAAGPDVVRALRTRGCDVFLDLKFHDIPNTVRKAVLAAVELDVALLTVHVAGGEQMVRAAVSSAGDRCRVFAVTVLTSLTAPELGAVWGRKLGSEDMTGEVLRLAELARGWGARGVVCSGHEAGPLRQHFGDSFELLVPGVRLPGDALGDQSRVVTPAEAARSGASYVILGRTVTASSDPAEAMERVVASLP